MQIKESKLKLAASFLLFLTMAVFLFSFADCALAQSRDIDAVLGTNYARNLDLPNSDQDPRDQAVTIVQYILTFMALVAVTVILYAGFLWMTSAGRPDQLARAKKILINGLIGLIIVIAAFTIVTYVIDIITDWFDGGGIGGGGGGGGIGGGGGGGLSAAASKAIESHYPGRGQTVPRNTYIAITFKEPMMAGDLISGTGLNPANVLIYRSEDGMSGPFATNFNASVTADNKTFQFAQFAPWLGNPDTNTRYTVSLMNTIRKENGDLVWPGIGSGYSWEFTVSTEIDSTPPRVESIVPRPAVSRARNIVIQINFNEAVAPVTAAGATASGFDNIEVRDSGALIDGNYYISNGYKTVEFLTEVPCGTNSCGNTIYCLPANGNISVLARAAEVATGLNGIYDMAGNSLDGNKDGIADGPTSESGNPPYNENSPAPATQGDDYTWSFTTTDEIDLTPPEIESVTPNSTAIDVDLNAAPTALFSKILMSASITRNTALPAGPANGSVALFARPASEWVNFSLGKSNASDKTTVRIGHDPFSELTGYIPEFNSGIKDIYQNCYRPAGGFGGGGLSPACTPNPPSQPFCCDGSAQALSCGN